jgi:hypothetical protein
LNIDVAAMFGKLNKMVPVSEMCKNNFSEEGNLEVIIGTN